MYSLLDIWKPPLNDHASQGDMGKWSTGSATGFLVFLDVSDGLRIWSWSWMDMYILVSSRGLGGVGDNFVAWRVRGRTASWPGCFASIWVCPQEIRQGLQNLDLFDNFVRRTRKSITPFYCSTTCLNEICKELCSCKKDLPESVKLQVNPSQKLYKYSQSLWIAFACLCPSWESWKPFCCWRHEQEDCPWPASWSGPTCRRICCSAGSSRRKWPATLCSEVVPVLPTSGHWKGNQTRLPFLDYHR